MAAPVEVATRRVIDTYGMMCGRDEAEEARARVGNYLSMLFSAGQTDAERLAVLGLRYLREKDTAPAGYTGL